MATARKKQISLVDTPYYHCVSRCVRRAFLCGEDKATGQSFEHRRTWVEDKLLLLGQVFAIDICAYTVMSNHTHLVLYVDEALAKSWSTKAVVERWHQLFKGTLLTQRYLRGDVLEKYLLVSLEETAELYRKRLMDISWFMRQLNESIARQANSEDNCTGRFWEGRFKSQALLDEAALAACLAYVDLNPVRAKIAKTPETSSHTSIKLRVEKAKQGQQPNNLLAFVGNPRKDMPKGLPFSLQDYLELVELTGRCIRENKRGYIEENTPVLLQRLHICPGNWLKLTTQFRKIFHGAVGHSDVLTDFCHHQHIQRRASIGASTQLFA